MALRAITVDQQGLRNGRMVFLECSLPVFGYPSAVPVLLGANGLDRHTEILPRVHRHPAHTKQSRIDRERQTDRHTYILVYASAVSTTFSMLLLFSQHLLRKFLFYCVVITGTVYCMLYACLLYTSRCV